MIIAEEDYLEHYGVKGQRWGVRRKREMARVKKRRKPMTSQQKIRVAMAVAVGTVYVASLAKGFQDISVNAAHSRRQKAVAESFTRDLMKMAGDFSVKDFGG